MSLSKSAQDPKIFRSKRGAVAFELCLAVVLITGCSSIPATFHQKHPLPSMEVTHQLWHEVLEVSVRDGYVNYPAIQGENRFDAYVNQLDRVDPAGLPTRDEQLAFWINAYNAFAMRGILDGESPAPYVGWYRYFKVRRYAVGGEVVTLYDLEHAILRTQFNEPRVHFAIVCASASCPKLRSWAFVG